MSQDSNEVRSLLRNSLTDNSSKENKNINQINETINVELSSKHKKIEVKVINDSNNNSVNTPLQSNNERSLSYDSNNNGIPLQMDRDLSRDLSKTSQYSEPNTRNKTKTVNNLTNISVLNPTSNSSKLYSPANSERSNVSSGWPVTNNVLEQTQLPNIEDNSIIEDDSIVKLSNEKTSLVNNGNSKSKELSPDEKLVEKYSKTKSYSSVVESKSLNSSNKKGINPYSYFVQEGKISDLRIASKLYWEEETEMQRKRLENKSKFYKPSYCVDWCMHKFFLGKLIIFIITWSPIINYGKDIFVTVHLEVLHDYYFFAVSLILMYLSFRLMLFLKITDDDKVTIPKLFLYYIPGLGVFLDSKFDDYKEDIAVCFASECGLLIGAFLMPFYLIYLSFRKSISLFNFKNHKNFENQYLLLFAVVELIFETIPQLCLQTYLFFNHKTHTKDKEKEISHNVFYLAWAVMALVILKIPFIIWWNWRIITHLSFKRHHTASIKSLRYHPYLDNIVSGSNDYTVIINDVISNLTKAKRVLTFDTQINCVRFSPKGRYLAVCSYNLQIYDIHNKYRLHRTFPKSYTKDKINRKKYMRTHEILDCIFSNDDRYIIFVNGNRLIMTDIEDKSVKFDKQVHNFNINNDGIDRGSNSGLIEITSVCISPKNKFIAVGTNKSTVHIFNSSNGDCIKVLDNNNNNALNGNNSFESDMYTINNISFDKRGYYLICSIDNIIKIYDIKKRWKQTKQFSLHEDEITSVSIDVTNSFIASASRDKKVYIFYLYNSHEKLKHLNNDISQLPNKPSTLHQAITDPISTPQYQKLGLKTIDLDSVALYSSDNVNGIYECVLFKEYDLEDTPNCIDFSPFNDFIAVGTEEHHIELLPLPKCCKNNLELDVNHRCHR